ncbi:quinone oxidoreductase family protein [Polluticaenibacter yanchengensis]|uniref:NADP-dependent oxidoreductase n=1 Tax=Polluticaenibacter yanchengensis TaxID=3014562 RepID=A0ABT4UF91_9BACT|nr:NADP-dependent oxidoreductase [Chitinophagaceae bacterium LY-5]
MKAIVLNEFGGVENFEEKEVDHPFVKDKEVLIRIKATAFNPIDYQMRRGAAESKLLKSNILGRELSGEIIKTGDKVSGFNIEDKVTAYVGSLASNGTYAELISVPQDLLAINPKGLSFEEATAIPMVGMTALQCFKRVKIPENKKIFIAGGAGGVGTILIKLLLANGNSQIYTTAGNSESINHLIALGLNNENIINYNEYDVCSVLEESDFDYVFDLVGGKMSDDCAKLVSVYGTYVDVTFLATETAKELLFDKATQIINIANYAQSFIKGEDKLSYYGKALKELFNRIEIGEITPTSIRLIGSLNVETVKKAHLLMEENKTFGKKLVMSIEG